MSVPEIILGVVLVLTVINLVSFVGIAKARPQWSAITTIKFLVVREANIVSNAFMPAIFAAIITAVLIGVGTAVFGIGELLFHQELALVSGFYESQTLFIALGSIGTFSLFVSYAISLESWFDIPFFSYLTFTDPVTGKTEEVLSNLS